ncbi:YcjF family protein [Oceaniglobus roseus]|uniref:YcjF family protein n=1 Tax=Oceaniglobus roseus TaxID=1737570 RepID=UPI000C7EB23D|nr:GTPase domain-containing protein [Kandeliimicrobium roseum]
MRSWRDRILERPRPAAAGAGGPAGAGSGVDPAALAQRDVPVVWLLGRTGAGKSSLIRALTGLDEIEVGNGYASCTRTSRRFDFPAAAPLVRFLDTRGLGEAGYDPREDLAACEGHSHAVIVVARLDDPAQGEVAEALGEVLRRRPAMEVLLVHTGADLVADPAARGRARAAAASRFARAAGRDLPEVVIGLPRDGQPAPDEMAALREALVVTLPNAGLALQQEAADDAEAQAFAAVRGTVLFYSGIAGGSDAFPVVGLFSSTGVQFTLLKKLGDHYGVPVTLALARNFVTLLGLGVGGRFLGSLLLRQGGKLIPGYGQTAGAVAAGAFTFAATYALGRTAARYLHTLSVGGTPSKADLQATFREALEGAWKRDR